MKPTPWLEKEDPRWTQAVKWNSARERFFADPTTLVFAYAEARKCPLIEEANWFLRVCDVNDRGDISFFPLSETVDTDLRLATYMAIISYDEAALRQCAIAGDPIAQGNVTPLNVKEEIQWLMKSMQGGYTEAFIKLTELYVTTNDSLSEAIAYSAKGIEAGSAEAMLRYSQLASLTPREKLYWHGRAWLEGAPDTRNFLLRGRPRLKSQNDALSNYQIQLNFVYGHILERARADKEKFDSEFWSLAECDDGVSRALRVYNSMCHNSKEAVHAWCLIGKRLRVVKDMIRMIAKLIWRSRDQAQWFILTALPTPKE